MTLISARDLGVGYGGRMLLQRADLAIQAGDRVALVGANGCGKTTLLHTLMGEIEPDQGEVVRWRGLRPVLLRQNIDPAQAGLSVRAVLGAALAPGEDEYRDFLITQALDRLGVPAALLDQRLGTLSGGWQRLVGLAAIEAADPNLVLLDEPTNHLDLEKVLLVEDWLAGQGERGVVMISHDRELLDGWANRTLVMHEGALIAIAQPFSQAMAVVQERVLAQQKARDVQEKEIARLTFTYKRLKHWGQTFNVKKLSRRATSMARRLERLKDDLPAATTTDRRRIGLGGGAVGSDQVVRLRDVEIRAPDGRALFHIEALTIQPGDRVVVMGRNGQGKTCFMRLLERVMRAGAPPDPAIAVSPQIRCAYFDQDLQRLPAEMSALAFLRGTVGGARAPLTAALVRAGIPADRVDLPTGRLSGGQRARLLLLALNLQSPNVYLLDEPTNHLDIQGMEQLEFDLATGDATAIIVSHDRRFAAEIGTRFLMIADGRLSEEDGPEPFLALLRAGAETPPPATAPPTIAADAALAEILRLEQRHPDPARRPKAVEARLRQLYAVLETAQGGFHA